MFKTGNGLFANSNLVYAVSVRMRMVVVLSIVAYRAHLDS
jgi:hypothetical protein